LGGGGGGGGCVFGIKVILVMEECDVMDGGISVWWSVMPTKRWRSGGIFEETYAVVPSFRRDGNFRTYLGYVTMTNKLWIFVEQLLFICLESFPVYLPIFLASS
jgi:hypothetical protein